MKSILIVDAFSTGVNYINDVINRKYQPVVLYEKMSDKADKSFDYWRSRIRSRYQDKAIFIDEQETLEETVKLVKQYDPIVVVPGSEGGVELAMQVTAALGLPGNDIKNIPNFTQKDCMQAALKDYGIRSIKGIIASSVEEAVEFYRNEELTGCVVKPIRGAGSVGVRICESEEQLIENFNFVKQGTNMFGNEVSILVQEKINGEEFIVNTVSYNGVHRLMGVWKYGKQIVKGGGKIYDYDMSLNQLEAGSTRLVRYAFDVLDAIGLKYGAVHGEYMVDDKGPVLIEVNCRPMGGNKTPAFLDPVQGHHETDTILDTYLYPEWHYEMTKKPYRNHAIGVSKFLITKEKLNVSTMPILSIIRHLRSYQSAILGEALSGSLPRTVDMETSSGTVELVHEDPSVIHHDLEYLRKIEKDYYGIFFTNEVEKKNKKPEKMASVNDIIAKYKCVGGVLVLSNEKDIDVNAVVANETTINDMNNIYNYGIMDITDDNNPGLEEYIDLFYRLVDHIRLGGHIIIPERAYWYLPHGAEGIEAICEASGLIIEAPTTDDRNVVIVTKNY